MRILVTGGARSGKSRHAVRLLNSAERVTFLAPGRPADQPDDPDWAARVAYHRAQRPAGWATVESPDVVATLRRETGPVLVDCLTTWLTTTIDQLELWDAPADEAYAAVDEQAEGLCTALEGRSDVVLVTNEVGAGIVPAHRSGRLFRDLLGALNQSVAGCCDEVHLVVCGRVLKL